MAEGVGDSSWSCWAPREGAEVQSINRILKKARRKLLHRLRPLEYARRCGVSFPDGGLYLYGNVNWGTEPWIITLGNNVHITDGVRFLTHDGGTLLFRDRIPDLEITKPIVIGDNVNLGNNVTLLPGLPSETTS